MGERCALNAPGQASGSGLESSPSPSHGSTGTGTSQSLGPSDRELIERARADDIAIDPAEARFLLMALADRLEALASRPAVVVAWAVKDFADDWILFDSEAAARREAKAMGNATVVRLRG